MAGVNALGLEESEEAKEHNKGPGDKEDVEESLRDRNDGVIAIVLVEIVVKPAHNLFSGAGANRGRWVIGKPLHIK